MKKVLVLNKDYQPLKIVTWKTAFLKLYSGAYDVLEYHDEFVNSAHESHQIPSVLILKNYVKAFSGEKIHSDKQKRGVKKKYVFFRDNHLCQYCTKEFDHNKLTLDHVVPRSKGGKLEYTNLVTACGPCNSKKADRSCIESGMFPVNKPRDINKFDMFRFMFSNRKDMETSWEKYFQHFFSF